MLVQQRVFALTSTSPQQHAGHVHFAEGLLEECMQPLILVHAATHSRACSHSLSHTEKQPLRWLARHAELHPEPRPGVAASTPAAAALGPRSPAALTAL